MSGVRAPRERFEIRRDRLPDVSVKFEVEEFRMLTGAVAGSAQKERGREPAPSNNLVSSVMWPNSSLFGFRLPARAGANAKAPLPAIRHLTFTYGVARRAAAEFATITPARDFMMPARKARFRPKFWRAPERNVRLYASTGAQPKRRPKPGPAGVPSEIHCGTVSAPEGAWI